jgi:hypothetical protein
MPQTVFEPVISESAQLTTVSKRTPLRLTKMLFSRLNTQYLMFKMEVCHGILNIYNSSKRNVLKKKGRCSQQASEAKHTCPTRSPNCYILSAPTQGGLAVTWFGRQLLNILVFEVAEKGREPEAWEVGRTCTESGAQKAWRAVFETNVP